MNQGADSNSMYVQKYIYCSDFH